MSPASTKPAYGDAVRAENLALAERQGAAWWDLEVVAVDDVTVSLRQLTFACHSPESLAYLPGNDLTLSIAARDGGVVRRRYSIRRVDDAARTVDLQFVLHGDGPAGRWASEAEVGDRIEGVGPRGKITVTPGRAWYLFVGDEAFLPAASSMIESLPHAADAFALFEVDGAADELVPSAKSNLALTWCDRDGAAAGTTMLLRKTLAELDLPSGQGVAYVSGEHATTNALREQLLARGMAVEDVAAKPYWRLGKANADHGEPPREV